jgi:LuxR family maltose regulon positive regulatory protein
MTTPILATKVYIPPPRPQLIRRPRLLARLTQGLQRKLTLISAPAGFGKTTLVSSWLAELQGAQSHPRPEAADAKVDQRSSTVVNSYAWLSLDDGDGDLVRFFDYFVAALQTVAPKLGTGLLAMLHSPQPPAPEIMLTTLLNEIVALPEQLILVLDDYHAVDSLAVDQALAFLIEHLPPQLHLVMTTREDPALPLARLRARGQLTEIRADDLRFTPEEAAEFLDRIMGLEIGPEDVAALEQRTEGWIAGLQLAALSMQGRSDLHGFVRAFAGDNRYIVDYLVEEVLQGQSAETRSFLLQTAILERLSGPLCDAVTAQGDGSARLAALERDNLFVISLDEKRQWFRYHHLFGDVLYAYLLEEEPDRIPLLHRRASAWYAAHDLPAPAIRHALAAGDWDRAAALIELAWPAMDQDRQSTVWRTWAEGLPDELVRTRPVLSAALAWAYLDAGQLEAAEARLRDAERLLARSEAPDQRDLAPAAMVVTDQEQFRVLSASMATAHTYLAQARGDLAATLRHARYALDHLPPDDYLRRAVPASLLGLAYWSQGELALADQTMADAMEGFRLAGNLLYAITGAYVLADIRMALGRLRAAFAVTERALALAEGAGEPVRWGTADLYTGLGEIYRERNELDRAADSLAKSKALGEETELPRWRFRWCIAQARLHEARGDADTARRLLDQAERHYVRGPVPDVRPIAAWTARLLLTQDRLAEAQTWVQDRGLSAGDELSYLREFEHVTLARVLLAQAAAGDDLQALAHAQTLLARLLAAAEAGGRTGSVMEILVLQALAHQAQGELEAALASLARAMALAEPEGYVRLFVDEGAPMHALLQAAAAQGVMADYPAKLLANFAATAPDAPPLSSPGGPPSAPITQPLIEPLSERELEVLQLVAQGLSNRQIGERLFLALSTVKGHNRNIYAKLQVRRRTEAVARARELGLLRE